MFANKDKVNAFIKKKKEKNEKKEKKRPYDD